MTLNFEVPEPIINSPFAEPAAFWYIQEGEPPEKRQGRRPSVVFPPRDQREAWQMVEGIIKRSELYSKGYELELVNELRKRVAKWRKDGWPGASVITDELLRYWRRDGRQHRLFFAQLEAAETVIFLKEARADYRQGLQIPRDDPSEQQQAEGHTGFERIACKMATGSGKTTVMGMLAAWSILNKLDSRNDTRFSDVVLILCPNVPIRIRLGELHPDQGEGSLYRKRDLVPAHHMPRLRQGKIIITNWHVLQPQTPQTGGESARVHKMGRQVTTTETITIGDKTTTARGTRYLTLEDFERQRAAGILEVVEEKREPDGSLWRVQVRATRYVESDTALVQRVLGREIGGKQNILVMNDEAHHAYRIRKDEDEEEDDLFGEEEEAEEFFKEATVWVEGLDKIQSKRGINFCLDFSATPYFLGRVGRETNKPFPWVVCDFGLIDSIEAGLVKIPQLAVRDTSGSDIPGYFNIWKWIVEEKLTPAERGGKKGSPKPEAVLKWANTPITMLGDLWEERLAQLSASDDLRPPVFILVCKNTRIAKVVFEWLGENKCPMGLPPCKVDGFRNKDGKVNTIRVDSKVVHETDTEGAKSDEDRWMRWTLETVGRRDWPRDSQGRAIYLEGFEDLAKKLNRPLFPPGRDVRCIVSVGMLTEGWDCSTVQFIIGLRPFMSQLLCEQVVGRGLRRASYEVGANDLMTEEVAKVLGVPFEVIPCKTNPGGSPPKAPDRRHVRAIPEKAQYEITYPRVEGYTQAIRNRIKVDWDSVAPLPLDPMKIPPEVEMKALNITNEGRPSLSGPGRLDQVNLQNFRQQHSLPELTYDLAGALTRSLVQQGQCSVPAHALFPQVASVVGRYVNERVVAAPGTDKRDLFLSPYYGWLLDILVAAIQSDTSEGEAPLVPVYEVNRGPGSTAEVDFWTVSDVREIQKSHVNYVVADTKKWEQSAAYYLDTNPRVAAFVKNKGLGFGITYFYNDEPHEYVPDFLVRLNTTPPLMLILETKGYDELADVKKQAAEKWVDAVNADGKYGQWVYRLVKKPEQVINVLIEAFSAQHSR